MKFADAFVPLVIVGSVGMGNAGSVGTLTTSLNSSFGFVGNSVTMTVGVRVGLVPRAWAISGHELSHIEFALQYIKPGPQLPYRDRHHEITSHGSPVQENSFFSTEAGVLSTALFDLTLFLAEGSYVGDSVMITSLDESEFISTRSSSTSEFIVDIVVVSSSDFETGDGEALSPKSTFPPPCGFSKAVELALLLGEGNISPDTGLGVKRLLDEVTDGVCVGSLAGQSFDQTAVSVQ